MVGASEAALHDLLHRVEEALERRGVGVGVAVAELSVDLRESRRAERILVVRAEIDVDEIRDLALPVRLEVWRERKANVVDGREARDDERKRRHLGLRLALGILPGRVHRAAVLAYRYRHADLGAELESELLNGIVEYRILAGLTARRHPVGGKPYLRDVADVSRSDVRQGFGDGHPAARRAVEKRYRGALACGHGLTLVCLVAHRRNGAVCGRQLVFADHLVAGDAACDRPVGDRYEERLVGDRRQVQNTRQHIEGLHALEVRALVAPLYALHVAHHSRRLAEQHLDIHIDRPIAEVLVLEDELAIACRDADERHWAALAFAEGLEELLCGGLERKHIALLSLAAPYLHRIHRALFVVNLPERELAAGRLDQLGAPVREAARANVVDGQYGVRLSEIAARIDYALAAALHLGVSALDAVEVERLGVCAGHHRARGASAEADAHRRTADLDYQRAHLHVLLLDLRAADDAHAAGEHYRLVVAAKFACDLAFIRAEEAA